MFSDWHRRYLHLAEHISEWSKDPSTAVGAVIVKGNKIIATGFNGYPAGVPDIGTEDRDYKLARTIHAEQNAIIQAAQDLSGAKIYCTHHPCSHCTALIIQSGIKYIFYNSDNLLPDRWDVSLDVSREMASICKNPVMIRGMSLQNPELDVSKPEFVFKMPEIEE